jgi:hypothetical protein
MPAKDTVATVISCLRYRDAPAAIDWLQRTFGFEPQLVVPDAQLRVAAVLGGARRAALPTCRRSHRFAATPTAQSALVPAPL